MPISTDPRPKVSPLRARLCRLARLDAATLTALATAERDQRRWPARREMVGEGDLIKPRAIVSGWAFQQRILGDGRRQIINFLIPGDLIGVCAHRQPVESASIVAVTEVVTCALPIAQAGTELAEAYALSAALEMHYLVQHSIRLGRLTAQERLIDWFLEIQGRLKLAGIVASDQFTVPLTQELLADTLGLTNVHVNRTLQVLRREGLLGAQGGTITLTDRAHLQSLVDHRPPRFVPKD
ncbi:Crp/Fnr family transcriptional regulator [Sphingomonas sp. PB2P19]|uniref:Crp/Fnr family transcriptional regulator n=1 Tax=Sphingomonas rhamnosi TaxID=3096156 RepID=UPI002FC99F13